MVGDLFVMCVIKISYYIFCFFLDIIAKACQVQVHSRAVPGFVMSVYYKWRNAPTFKSIKVDGDGISVADFKAEISSKMGTGDSDLLITAEGTGHGMVSF